MENNPYNVEITADGTQSEQEEIVVNTNEKQIHHNFSNH